jgi:uncharacterized protein (UPF0276 family)
LDRFCERHPIILHGVGLSIGAPDEPSRDYLERLKALVRRVKPAWVSDHFCFCGAGGAHLHDLLPLPFTEQTATLIARRAKMVQDFLEVPFGLENTSSYLAYAASYMSEWDFVRQVVEQADCGLMFDVNNVYVSAYNHGFDPLEFVKNVPHERILQIHVAGHTNFGKYIIDTHSGPAIDPVMDLYRETIRRAGPVSTLLEWDDDLPAFDVLQGEVARLAGVRHEGLDPDCPVLERDVVVRRAQEEGAPEERAWAQGGPTPSLQNWQEAPRADALLAERGESP